MSVCCTQEAGMMAAMRHPNVVLYLGVCLDPPCVVTEYCARGSLNDVLKRALYNSKYAEQLDWRVRCALTACPILLLFIS
jgi:serine/threonine protein kinase